MSPEDVRPEAVRPETAAVVLGRGAERPGDPVNPPVVLSSTYHAEGDLTYGRDGNETWMALEQVLGALEGGTARIFSSGVAAIAAVVEMLPVGAAVVAEAGAYSGTRKLLADLHDKRRLSVRLVDTTDVAATIAALDGADLVWLESPTNPLLDVVDIAAVAAAAHERGTLVAVDNTFATPLVQRPLELGADVVVHSMTKLISGHSDVIMGAVVARDDDLVEAIHRRRNLHGAIAGPMEAFLALRGIRTLAVRLERCTASATELARRLSQHPAVARVRYPGFGAVVSFELATREAADKVCAAVRLIVHATSLGGVESLIERRGRWAFEEHLPPGLIRFSVGLEHVEDLWEDLEQALAAAGG